MGIGVNSTDPAAVTVHGTNPQVSARRVMGSAAPALRMPTPSVLCSAAPARGGCWAVPAAAADADAVRRAAAVAAGGPARARRGACVRCACKARAGAGRVASRAPRWCVREERRARCFSGPSTAGRGRAGLGRSYSMRALTHVFPPHRRGQFLMEKILRQKIQGDAYWKEFCFALTAETVVDRSPSLARARSLSLSLTHISLSLSFSLSLSSSLSFSLSFSLSLSLSLSL